MTIYLNQIESCYVNQMKNSSVSNRKLFTDSKCSVNRWWWTHPNLVFEDFNDVAKGSLKGTSGFSDPLKKKGRRIEFEVPKKSLVEWLKRSDLAVIAFCISFIISL